MLLRPEISGNLFLLENNGTHFGRFFFFGIVVCHGTPKRKNPKFLVEFSRFKCLIKHRNTCRCVLSADSSASCGTWDCGGSTGCPDDDAGCQAATSGGCSCCWPPDVQAIKRPQPPYDDGFCGKKKETTPGTKLQNGGLCVCVQRIFIKFIFTSMSRFIIFQQPPPGAINTFHGTKAFLFHPSIPAGHPSG